MKKLYICTNYGNAYHILENGNIIRLDQKDFKPSGQWQLRGICHIKKNWFISLADLFNGAFTGLELLYKNGKPQFTVADYDHGSNRIWGNSGVHGIKTIYLTE